MGDDSQEPDDEPVQVSHMVPRHHREQASKNTEYGVVSEAVREVYRLLAEGADLDAVRLEMKLNMVRRDRKRVEEQIADLRSELDHLGSREDELKERVEQYTDREDEYERLMSELDEELTNGYAVFTDHGKVQKAAQASDKTPSEIMDALRERNPNVPEPLFEDATESETTPGTSQFTSVSRRNQK